MLLIQPFDFYGAYCEKFGRVYGMDKCPTREQWDRMCSKPRQARKLNDTEFDANQESLTNGKTEIY
jgi:hypothetical protein